MLVKGFLKNKYCQAGHSSRLITILCWNVKEKVSEFLYRVCKATYGTMLQINEGFHSLKGTHFISAFIDIFSSTLSVLFCLYDIF